MFLYTSGSTGVPKGVVLSHQSHLWVVQTRLTKDLARHRYLIAAPLYHMNALALSQLATAAHATIVLLPQFSAAAYIDAIERYRCTWLTAVPPMIAMMLREAEPLSRADLSSVEFVRMGSAPVSEALMAALKRALPKAAVTNAYGTTEGGPVVFGPHPKGLPQPELSVGYPHPGVQVRLVDADGNIGNAGRARDESAFADERLPQPPRPALADHAPTASTSPATCSAATSTASTFLSAAPTTCSSRAARTSIPAMSSACSSATRTSPRPAWFRSTTKSKARSRSRSSSSSRAAHPSDSEVKQYALKHAPAYQHPRFVWFVEKLPLSSTNKVDRTALKREAETRIAQLA